MKDISISFLQELGYYDVVFRMFYEEYSIEQVQEDIIKERKQGDVGDSRHICEWDTIVSDIEQSKQKIAKFDKEIRKLVKENSISSEKYAEIIVVSDSVRRHELLKEFVIEYTHRVKGIVLSTENIEKVVRHLTTQDEMSDMRKTLALDRINISEALSLLFIENKDVQDLLIQQICNETEKLTNKKFKEYQKNTIFLFENALEKTAHTLSCIE